MISSQSHSIETFLYFDDVGEDDRFQGLNSLSELSIKFVATKKHDLYGRVFLILKLALILPVASATVERVFSRLNLVKNQTSNCMCDELLNDCLAIFIYREFFSIISEGDIIHTFIAMRNRNTKALDYISIVIFYLCNFLLMLQLFIL